MHVCVRRHRDEAVTVWRVLADASAAALRAFSDVGETHPVWSNRPSKVFLYTADDVQRVVQYIEQNPVKEGLGAQRWEFVAPYDGWPHR